MTEYEYERTFHKIEEEEPVKPVQINIYQSNTYGKDLTWLPFNYEPRLQKKAASEGPTILNIFLCSLSNISVITTSVFRVDNIPLEIISFRD